jgi:outer membrane protein OmpA-like peptidoglycan-associated protein
MVWLLWRGARAAAILQIRKPACLKQMYRMEIQMTTSKSQNSNTSPVPSTAAARLRHAALIATVAAFGLSACAGMSDTQRRTATGAGIGSAVGAIIGGSQSGGKGVRNGALIGGAAAGLGSYIWSSRMESQKRAMEESTKGTGVQVTQTEENLLRLEIPSDISFAVNRADIRSDFRPILDRFSQTLVANPAATVQIIGHTDSTGSDAINNPLSVNRAASTRDYLTAHGVQGSRIMIDGRGASDPVADNNTTAGRAQNRRVEIYVGESTQAATPGRQVN